MQLSIVTTMYHSEPYLREFYERIVAVANRVTKSYEIIFVNDGSPDKSLDLVLELKSKDDRIRVVDLSRNFGHHEAAITGLKFAKGDYTLLIDCDLEEEPEILEEFWGVMQENPDVDVVYGVQEERKGKFFKKISGYLFYTLINKMLDTNIPRNLLTIRLMTSRFVKALNFFEEKNLFLAGVMELAGYEKKKIAVKKLEKGLSQYTLKKKITLFINIISSFTAYPLHIIFRTGLIISIISLLGAVFLVINKILNENLELGWSSLMVSLWFIGGVLMMFIGIIGIYLSKIFVEIKNRPRTIIKQIYD